MRRTAFACALISFFSGTSAYAFQQSSSPEAASVADASEIIVTAQKRAESLQAVPLAVSAFQGDALGNRAASTLGDIQTLVPAVNIQQRFASGVVTIRGIGFDVINAGAESSVALHLDGIYMSRPASALSGLFDVERIEVARGPQGTLYGRNATGGAINIITKKPTDDFEGSARLTVGNYNMISGEAAVGGPLVDGISVRLAAKIDRRDGYGKNLFNGRDVEDLHSDAFRGQIMFKPSETVSLLVSGDYFRENDSAFVFHYGGAVNPGCTPNCGVNRGGEVPTNLRDVNQNVQPENRRRYWGVTATGKVELTDEVTLTSITGYRKTNSMFLADLDGTSADLTDVGRVERQRQFSQEVNLGAELDNLSLLAGLYYFYENVDGLGTSTFNPDTMNGLIYFCQCGTLRTKAYAAYGQMTYRFNDHLSVTLGGRYSHEKKSVIDEVLIFQPNPDTVRPPNSPSSLSFNAFTPKFGIEYKFDSRKLLYVNVQKGFKSGSFALGAVTPGFDPEEVWSYEVGLKATWLGGAVRTNLAAFHYDYSDLQVGFVQGLTPVIQNAASAKVDGAEFEISVEPVRNLRFEAVGAYLDSRFTSYKTADNSRPALGELDLSGNRLSQAPKFSATFAANYTIPVKEGSVDLRGEAFVSSRVYFSPFNLDNVSQGRYSLYNAFATWKTDSGFTVGGFIKNITNKEYLAGAAISSPLVGPTVNVTLGTPRTYGVTLGYQF